MHLLRKYLVGSLIFHLLILLIASLIALSTKSIKQTFIVLGAHSGKPTAVNYKSFKTVVPIQTKDISSASDVQRAAKQPKKNNVAKKIPQKKVAEKKKSIGTKKKTAPKAGRLKEPALPSKKQPVVKKPALVKNKIVEKKLPEKEVKPIEKIQEPLPKKQEKKLDKKQPKAPEQVVTDQEKRDVPDDAKPKIDAVFQEQKNDAHDAPIEVETIVVGDNNNQYVTEYQKVINQEAARVWRPPVGVPQGTTCFVTFTIAQDGTHENDLTQSSPVIIYDLSVMRAARAMKFPKSLWGKQFKIAFRQ